MPKLTIIVPVFNGEKTLERAVNSVLTQSFKDWEMILIDDGSVDRSGEICDYFDELYENIICFHQENRGLSAARNVGIRNARGTYLTFLDADDWIEADYYFDLIQAQEKSSAEMIMSGYVREFWKKDRCRKSVTIVGENQFVSFSKEYSQFLRTPFAYNLFIHVWNKLYLRSIIESNQILFDEKIRFAEDVPFNLLYYQNVERIFIIQQPGYHYMCLNNGNLTAKWSSNLIESNCYTYRCIRDFLGNFIDSDDLELIQNMYLRGCFLNLEKALAKRVPYTRLKSVIREVCTVEETLECLNSKFFFNINAVEFTIYRIFLYLKQPLLIYISVYFRKCIKHLLGRL